MIQVSVENGGCVFSNLSRSDDNWKHDSLKGKYCEHLVYMI